MKISRRIFGKLLSVLSIGSANISPLGAAECQDDEDDEDLIEFKNPITAPKNAVFFWINGIFFGKNYLNKGGNITFFLKVPQNTNHFVEKVVFANELKKTLAVRYFDAKDKTATGYPPYIMINRIDLVRNDKFFLVYRVREGKEKKVYRKTISQTDLQRGDFRDRQNQQQLPAKMRFELQEARHQGIVTSSMNFKSNISTTDVAKHIVKANLLELRDDNNFKIKIPFLHDDIDKDHYMRYFFVTDPVGRLLGLKKRTYTPGNSEKFVIVSAMTEKEKNEWGLTSEKVAKINDCPYVMVFVDDVKEAIAQSIIWFR